MPARKVVVDRRPRTYPHRPKANREIVVNGKRVKPDDPGGEGWEIVDELNVCPACFVATHGE